MLESRGADPEGCWLCRGRSVEARLTVKGYPIVVCRECGLEWVHPRPDPAALQAFYDSDEYFRCPEEGYPDYLAAEPAHRRLARHRLEIISEWMKAGRLLDVGCAAGFFLAEAQVRGWEVAGVELSTAMRSRVAVLTGGRAYPSLRDAAELLGTVDLVTMWEYIEHTPDPMSDLAAAATILRPGGLLALSTPNTAHRLARLDPARWTEYRPPAHLTFFTAATLGRCLRAQGFTVLRTRHTTPLMRFDSAGMRGLRQVGHWLGTGADRRTGLWPVYSLLQRLHSLPARLLRLRQPELYSVGVEVYAARR